MRMVVTDGAEFLDVNGHRIEVMALDRIVAKLQDDKSLRFVLKGERPGLRKANEERFFEQLKENVDERKYGWIKELFDYVNRHEGFSVKWAKGGGGSPCASS